MQEFQDMKAENKLYVAKLYLEYLKNNALTPSVPIDIPSLIPTVLNLKGSKEMPDFY